MTPMQNWARTTGREKAGTIIVALGVIGPAVIASGFVFEVNPLASATWGIVTAVAGATGGALLARSARWLAALLGLLAGPVTLLAVDAYVQVCRAMGHSEDFYVLEFMIPIVLVLGPVAWLHGRTQRNARSTRKSRR